MTPEPEASLRDDARAYLADPNLVQAPGAPLGVTALGEMRPVGELLRALTRTIKMIRLYPDNNPVVARAVDDLQERFTLAFQQFDALRFVVGQNKILFHGEPVYESADPEESLARILFRDGLREIAFHIGFDRTELTRFVALFRGALAHERADDLVTLLWDAELPHLTYMAVDEIIDADAERDAVPDEFDSEFMTSLDFELDLMEPEDEPTGGAAREAVAAASEIQKNLRGSDQSNLLTLDPEEVRGLMREISDEDPAALSARIVDTLLEMLRLDPDPAARDTVLQTLERSLATLVAQRQFRVAARLLSGVDAIAGQEPSFADQMATARANLAAAAGELAQMELISEVLERGVKSEFDEVMEFLEALPASGVGALLTLLRRAGNARVQKRLFERLALLPAGCAVELALALDDTNPAIVVGLLQVLAQLGERSVVRAIQPMTSHADPRIRQEALATLSILGDAGARASLAAALRDPDTRLRLAAARSLGALGATGVNALLNAVLARDFEQKHLDERRAFFEALGSTGSPEVLTLLRHLMEKKPLLNRQKAEEGRICAVEALARLAHPSAQLLMEAALKDPAPRVRSAAAAARRRLGEQVRMVEECPDAE